jgi:hypothetical protein
MGAAPEFVDAQDGSQRHPAAIAVGCPEGLLVPPGMFKQ